MFAVASVSRTVLLGMGCLAVAFGAVAGVTAAPARVIFYDTDQHAEIRLFAEGMPLAPSSMRGWRLLVGDSSYSHMLRVTPKEEVLIVQPSESAEVGSYLLVIDTARGMASVEVYTPLSDQASIVEVLARRMNMGMDEARTRLGLTTRGIGIEEITLSLPPVHYQGQILRMDMETAPGRQSVWKVNGEQFPAGAEANRLEHTFTEPGPRLIAYEEYEGGRLRASGAGLTEVVAEPPLAHEAQVGARVTFHAPAGYENYTWWVDGKEAAVGALCEQVFKFPARHLVKVRASQPAARDGFAFREVVYEVHAVQQSRKGH